MHVKNCDAVLVPVIVGTAPIRTSDCPAGIRKLEVVTALVAAPIET